MKQNTNGEYVELTAETIQGVPKVQKFEFSIKRVSRSKVMEQNLHNQILRTFGGTPCIQRKVKDRIVHYLVLRVVIFVNINRVWNGMVVW